MGEDMEKYGYPEVGQIVEIESRGEDVIRLVGGSTMSLVSGRHEDISAWGYIVGPKGVKLSETYRGTNWRPSPSWGRKGPIVPPCVGMVVQWSHEKPKRIARMNDHSVYYDTGGWDPISLWGDEKIVSLPDGFSWPPKDVDTFQVRVLGPGEERPLRRVWTPSLVVPELSAPAPTGHDAELLISSLRKRAEDAERERDRYRAFSESQARQIAALEKARVR